MWRGGRAQPQESCTAHASGTWHGVLGGAPVRARLGVPCLVVRCKALVRCSGVRWAVPAGSAAPGFLLAPALPVARGPPKTGTNSGPCADSRYWHSSLGSPGTRGPLPWGIWVADLGLAAPKSSAGTEGHARAARDWGALPLPAIAYVMLQVPACSTSVRCVVPQTTRMGCIRSNSSSLQ